MLLLSASVQAVLRKTRLKRVREERTPKKWWGKWWNKCETSLEKMRSNMQLLERIAEETCWTKCWICFLSRKRMKWVRGERERERGVFRSAVVAQRRNKSGWTTPNTQVESYRSSPRETHPGTHTWTKRCKKWPRKEQRIWTRVRTVKAMYSRDGRGRKDIQHLYRERERARI